MAYISSNENRFYVGAESAFGVTPAITERNRFPAVRLKARQESERRTRRDKTGGRTYTGLPLGTRRKTSFELETYMTSWSDQTGTPAYGALFSAAMGKAGAIFPGATLEGVLSPTRLRFTTAHGLNAGQAITFGGEMRFVSSVVNTNTVNIHAPFTIQPAPGSMIGPSVTYSLGKELPSVSIFDYWQEGGVNRILSGAGVDELQVQVNGDFHNFRFNGPSCDLIDDSSFSTGEAGLDSFPVEPPLAAANQTVIPGHLGQVWLGATPHRYYTLTAADLTLNNDIDARFHEFGSQTLRCVSAGRRSVMIDFELFAEDDADTKSLYQSARQQSPISIIIQLGEQPGQLFGAYVKSVVPEVPSFDDSDNRLRWKFQECQAQGTVDDEFVVAFG